MSGSTRAVSGCASDNQPADAGAGIHMWLHSSELEMAPLPTAPGCGRLHARNVLHEWRLGQAADDASILVSELLTNSVKSSRHQGTPVRLHLLADRSRLIIEAWDRNSQPPQPQQADCTDESGRGLNVIAALAVRWGYYRSGIWKVVWAEMPLAAVIQDR